MRAARRSSRIRSPAPPSRPALWVLRASALPLPRRHPHPTPPERTPVTEHGDSEDTEGVRAVILAEACYLGWQESLLLLAKLVEAEVPG